MNRSTGGARYNHQSYSNQQNSSYRRNGGRHRDHRGGGGNHQPYRHSSSDRGQHSNHRPRGPRPAGNRFSSSSAQVSDPQVIMQRSLAVMVSRLGELVTSNTNVKDEETTTENAMSLDHSPPIDTCESNQTRIAQNIESLAQVVCDEAQAPMFLKYESDSSTSISPSDAAGPLAQLIVNCAATLPLQTSAYVGLTKAINTQAPKEYAGFAARCVDYTILTISHYLDLAILEQNEAKLEVQYSEVLPSLILLLRYLALLGKANVVRGFHEDHKEDPTTVLGLLLLLKRAACETSNKNSRWLLCYCVLTTLPYVLSYIPSPLLLENIVEPLESLELYVSVFAPGLGSRSLLLRHEQSEGHDVDDEAQDDDDEEEDDDTTTNQVCDTFQDLFRCVKRLVKDPDNCSIRFKLWTISPWSHQDYITPESKIPLAFLTCRSIPDILHKREVKQFRPHGWDGWLIFGRLPIFGSPLDDNVEDDDDDEENDMKDDLTPANLKAYQQNYSLLDRYFIADSIRLCLLCHHCTITNAGVTRGSAKSTAQELWSISQLLGTTDGSQGLEYLCVETLMALILQAGPGPLPSFYVSRVLLELVRAQPSVVPQALAVGASNLVQLYLPSLSPICRDQFAQWLTFHLTNTDYQWPKAYWDYWASHVTQNHYSKRNSRGDFVLYALELMRENVSSLDTLVTNCLPSNSTLIDHILQDISLLSNEKSETERELQRRIWEQKDDAKQVRSFLETWSQNDTPFWQTELIARVLLIPVENHRGQLCRNVREGLSSEISETGLGSQGEGNTANSKEDTLVIVSENIIRFKGLIQEIIETETKEHADMNSMEEGSDLLGCIKFLNTVGTMTSNYHVLLGGCLKCFLENGIIGSNAVIQWSLGHSEASQVLHWWSYAVMAVRVGLEQVKDSSNDTTDFVIDNSGENDSETIIGNALVHNMKDFAVPIVKNAVIQVCRKLSKISDVKKLTPMDVDLLEGLKHFFLESRLLIHDALTTMGNKPLASSEAMQILVKDFDLSGEALSKECRNSGFQSPAVTAIITIFETMD
jgi:MIF4G like